MLDENKDIEKVNEEEVVTPEVVDNNQEVKEDVEPPFVEDPNDRRHIPWVPLVCMGVIVLLMIVCIIVIMCTGGPINGGTTSGN